MKDKFTQAVGVIRTSTDRQSTDVQRSYIENFCKDNKLELLEVYEDINISGKCNIIKRPGLVCALGRLDSSTCLVVYALDRLARKKSLWHDIADEVQCNKSEIYSCTEDVNDWNRIIDGANYEHESIKRRTKDKLKQLRVSNRRFSKSKYGWTYDKNGFGSEVKKEQEVLKYMRDRRQSGAPYTKISDELNNIGYTRRDSKKWNRQSVCRTYVNDEKHIKMINDITGRRNEIIEFAEKESEKIRIRITHGLNNLKNTGRKWCRSKTGIRWDANGRPVVVKDELETLQFIKDKLSCGLSYANIADALNEKGKTTMRGKTFTRQNVYVIHSTDEKFSVQEILDSSL